MTAFSRIANVACSTKRSPTLSSGKRSTPTANLTGIYCTPLDPVDPELRQRLALDTPHELLQVFVASTSTTIDIKEGDYLTVSSVDYPIRSCAEWTWKKKQYVHLIVENLKR